VDVDAIEMGWAMSIHKAQGSEYDTVVVVVHESHGIMLNREVLYTGATRAKKKLYVVGTEACISRCVHHKCKLRNTGLCHMLVTHK